MIYDEIVKEVGLPNGNIKGNAMQSIKYEANGEASDWFLGEHGIVSVSPELGILDSESDKFFIKSSTMLEHIILENQKWVFNTLKKL